MKEVNLSKSAWHTKFYKWATGKSVKWNNLCPYFWSLVSLLLISSLILLWKIVKTVFNGAVSGVKYVDSVVPKAKKTNSTKKVKTKKPKSNEELKRKEKRADVAKTVFNWIGYVFVGLYFLWVFVLIVMGFIKLFTSCGALMAFVYIFAFIGVIAFLVLISFLLGSYFQSDTHSMVVGIFRAKKQKYCPHINWRD